jgi:hypothetical protein
MRNWKQLFSAGAMALGVLALTVFASTDVRAEASAVDPVAMQKMKRMADFLERQQQFSVSTQSIVEETRYSGHRVDFDLSASVVVKRPDKLSAVRSGELLNEQLIYDGKKLTLYRPTDKAYSTVDAPASIEKMIDYARETVGILLPAADMLYRGAYPLMTQDVTLAAVVGKATIGGIDCDHLLFSRPGVDFQIWIAAGERPFPCKYVVTETDPPTKPSITTFLSNWNFSPAVQDARFSFVPPKDARAIPMPHQVAGNSDNSSR